MSFRAPKQTHLYLRSWVSVCSAIVQKVCPLLPIISHKSASLLSLNPPFHWTQFNHGEETQTQAQINSQSGLKTWSKRNESLSNSRYVFWQWGITVYTFVFCNSWLIRLHLDLKCSFQKGTYITLLQFHCRCLNLHYILLCHIFDKDNLTTYGFCFDAYWTAIRHTELSSGWFELWHNSSAIDPSSGTDSSKGTSDFIAIATCQ